MGLPVSGVRGAANESRPARLCPIGCAALVVACVVATAPVAEMGVDNDWKYALN
jgi:hypothetical protein